MTGPFVSANAADVMRAVAATATAPKDNLNRMCRFLPNDWTGFPHDAPKLGLAGPATKFADADSRYRDRAF